MRSAKKSPRTRLKMYAEKQEVVDYIDLLQRPASAPRAQNSKAQQRSRDDGQGDGNNRLGRQRPRQFGRQRSEGDGERGRKNVDNAESDDEVEEEGRRPAVADSTDDDAGSSRGVRRQPRRHRIRTQFPRPAPDLLAAVPGLGHPDLNAGQRRYLRATASIYSVDWAWRALRDGHCDLLKHELGKSGSEVHKQHTDWIYGRHKRLFQTDPSVWRKSRLRSVSATVSSGKRQEKFDSEQKPRNSRQNEEAAAAAATSNERRRKASKTRARSASNRRNSGTDQSPSRQQSSTSMAKNGRHGSRSSSPDEGQKDLNKIMY